MPSDNPRSQADQGLRGSETSGEAPSALSRLRARSRVLDAALAVHQRVSAVGGSALASAIALAAFLSLFPLLLVGIAVMGFFSAGDVDFADDVVEELGLEGETADTVVDAIETAERSRHAATAVGLVGLGWSGLAVAGALQTTLNAAWQVKGRGLSNKLWAVLWLFTVGVVLLASVAAAPLLAWVPGPAVVPSLLGTLVIDVLLFLSMFSLLTNVHVPWRAHLPGAIAAALGFGILKGISGIYVPRLVESASLWGSIGVVFAILAWLLVLSRLVIYCAALNVVTYERRHGTVSAEIEVPRIDGEVALTATRGGAVSEAVTPAEQDRGPS
jgi:membrane protein